MSPRAYYNEHDRLKAAVLREAIKAGAIAPGDVDERSITDIRPGDLVGYTQCHFFAGGGFWSLALRLAGWPDDRPVWTGSCPCPSFSAAGKGGGFDDPRHLWPAWDRLIGEYRPAVVFGEQADDAVGYGWLDLVQTDLERKAYAVGAAVLGACSVGAPHIRQRLYFVGDAGGEGLEGWDGVRRSGQWPVRAAGVDGQLEIARGERRAARCTSESGRESGHALAEHRSLASFLEKPGHAQVRRSAGSSKATGGRTPGAPTGPSDARYEQRSWERRPSERGENRGSGPVGGYWRDAEWIPCRNPKVPGGVEWRPIERGTFVLAARYPERVAELRLAGDAINVYTAKAFIEAYLGCRE